MHDFQTTLLQCGLVDLGFQGYRYTWRNGRRGVDFVEQRLDRVCASEDWRELYPQAKVLHTTAAYSDHNPILLTTEPTGVHHHRKPKLHQFEEKWVAHPECEDQIRTSWTQSQPTGSPMFCLFEKIKRCRMTLWLGVGIPLGTPETG